MERFIIDNYYCELDRRIILHIFETFCILFPQRHLQRDRIAVVKWDRDYPLTALQRMNPGQTENFRICLNASTKYWSQIIYQLSHELSHVVMDCYPQTDALKWIPECLCEAASDYLLELSGAFFEKFDPSYACCHADYLATHLADSGEIREVSLAGFCQTRAKELATDPTEIENKGRPRNNLIGKYLYRLIRLNPVGWQAITLFSAPILRDCTDTRTFSQAWHSCCQTEEQTAFVNALSRMLFDRSAAE